MKAEKDVFDFSAGFRWRVLRQIVKKGVSFAYPLPKTYKFLSIFFKKRPNQLGPHLYHIDNTFLTFLYNSVSTHGIATISTKTIPLYTLKSKIEPGIFTLYFHSDNNAGCIK
ncbi:hypothetical protein QFZ77_002487 [Paenibacillus sp. V4I3]|nr:hypothetical protein [Paenibacillus sp. V4I3]